MHKILLPILVIAIFALGFFVAKDTLTRVYSDLRGRAESIVTPLETPGCNADCQKAIDEKVAKAVATLSGTTRLVVGGGSPAQKPQDSYITISGSGSTTNMNWANVSGTDFSFDVNNDFYPGAKFAWEGFLRIAGGNGTAYARIYDVTHGIGVNGSEISISSQADYAKANSANMNFWAGRNIYRVQIKSLNSFVVDYMGGKIRISY